MRGAAEVAAGNGSRARLVPIGNDAERIEPFVGDAAKPEIVRQDDGYQVVRFGTREEFDGCR